MTEVTEVLPDHSPLGGSGAERWMVCPGSVPLTDKVMAPNSGFEIFTPDEPEYRKEGSCAHDAAAFALANNAEAWELMGKTFAGAEVAAEMVEDIEFYLAYARNLIAKSEYHKVEQKFHRPDLHKWYYGTADLECAYKEGTNTVVFHVADLKFGKGIVKEAKDNPQLMYYAFGLLEGKDREDVDVVRLSIVQPRAFHKDGPVRSWDISTTDLMKWGKDVLLPAMEATEWDTSLVPGEHCGFCNAKLACPKLKESNTVVVNNLPALENEGLAKYSLTQLVDLYVHFDKVKVLMKAVNDAVYTALNKGYEDPRVKLAASKSDRVWKDEAMVEAEKIFPVNKLYTQPEFVSPATIDKLGAEGKKFTKEWAYTPHTGTTLALASSKKAAIKVASASEKFASAVDNLEIPGFLKRGEK